jgi:hypothetical protein
VAQVSPIMPAIGLFVLSLFGGVVAVFLMKGPALFDSLWIVQSILLPQACLNAAVGAGLFWIMNQRIVMDRLKAFD